MAIESPSVSRLCIWLEMRDCSPIAWLAYRSLGWENKRANIETGRVRDDACRPFTGGFFFLSALNKFYRCAWPQQLQSLWQCQIPMAWSGLPIVANKVPHWTRSRRTSREDRKETLATVCEDTMYRVFTGGGTLPSCMMPLV